MRRFRTRICPLAIRFLKPLCALPEFEELLASMRTSRYASSLLTDMDGKPISYRAAQGQSLVGDFAMRFFKAYVGVGPFLNFDRSRAEETYGDGLVSFRAGT